MKNQMDCGRKTTRYKSQKICKNHYFLPFQNDSCFLNRKSPVFCGFRRMTGSVDCAKESSHVGGFPLAIRGEAL